MQRNKGATDDLKNGCFWRGALAANGSGMIAIQDPGWLGFVY